MKRQTLLLFNGVALATTMLASVASADDKDMQAPTGGSMPTTAAPIPTPPQAGQAGQTAQDVTSTVQSTTIQTSQTPATQSPTAGAVGTTRLTSGDSPAITGAVPTEPQRDSVTVYRKTRPNVPMLVTGSTLLLGSYIPTAIIGGSSDREADKNLYIPVVGPWLNLADRQCSGCDNETRNVALIVTSGIVQGVGAGLTLASFLLPQKVAAATIQAGNVKMNVVPTQMGRGGAGLGAVGTF